MSHEVYICYDEMDQITADAICHVLEENKIKCWMKTRDLGVNHIVEEIMEAINEARAIVLIFSDHSKNSNYVNSEVDIAFTENKPILVFKIDESKLDGSLEFFLSNKHWLEAYPNPEVQFGKLVRDTSKLLGKPVPDPVIPKIENTGIKEPVPEKPKPEVPHKPKAQTQSKDEKQKSDSDGSGFGGIISSYKKPIIALAVILIAAIGIFAYMSLSDGNMGSSDTLIDGKNATIKITDFHIEDISKKGYSGKYSYYVGGTINPQPSDDGGYVINANFYNKDGDLINTTKTEFSAVQRVSEGYLLSSTVSNEKNIDRVEVELLNSKGIVFAQSESTL